MNIDVKAFWDAIGKTDTFVSVVTEIRSIIAMVSEKQIQTKLKNLYSGIDFSVLPDDMDYCADKVESYIAHQKCRIIGDDLFGEEEKNEFIQEFFEKNNDLLPYRNYVTPILSNFVDELEELLVKQITIGESLIYHKLVNNTGYFKEIIKQLKMLTTPSIDTIYTANKLYVDSFREVLFLHNKQKDNKVTLKNLFVMQKYTDSEQSIKDTSKTDLPNRIIEFVNKDKVPFIFIEGDAGCGKSSLIGWINHNVYCQNAFAKQFLNNKTLITIRLRDLDKKLISDNDSLIPAILKYMHLESIANLEKIFPDAIMILDGFDELCMIEGITNYEELIYDISRRKPKNYKLIITTRPKYIKVGSINIPHSFIKLQHFDAEQRAKWIEHYTSPDFCAQSIDPQIKSYIESIEDGEASGICDTPMTLYMLASKRIEVNALSNIWFLYHQIFYEELSVTEYNQMFPDPNNDYAHRIIKHRDILYQVSEEIAYQMYCTGNNKLYLSTDELYKIIETLSQKDGNLKHAEIKALVERCYALCNYWKTDSDYGVVEFYHNNIRDFFLCEKIYREMNSIYELLQNNRMNIHDAVIYLCKVFNHSSLETVTCKFLLLRCLSTFEEREREFPTIEYEHRYLSDIYEVMLTNGDVYSELYGKNPIQKIINVLTCVAQIYRHIYEPFLQKKETIKWWNCVQNVNKNGLLPYVFRSIFQQVPVTFDDGTILTMASCCDFSDLQLQTIDLRNIGFQMSDLTNVQFNDTILCGCDFSGANLSGSDFTNADMHYASLEYANLECCNLMYVDLRGTNLPDGNCSVVQEEQIIHLKSLGISGLLI